MIKNKSELRKYIKADEIMNGFSTSLIKKIIKPNHIQLYLKFMRYTSYYSHKKGIIYRLLFAYYYKKFYSYSVKLGFSIGYDCFGYGLVIPHYGTIVVNENTKAGNFCVLHTSTCIGGGNKNIGDALYLSTGAMIMGKNINLGNNVSVCSNSLINKNIHDSCLIGGPKPNFILKENYLPWYIRDGFYDRINKCLEMFEK